MSLAVLVLAGGEGSRMGGGKPLRLLGGRSLLDRALERARRWSGRVAVAARSADQIGDCGAPLLIDPPGLAGPLAGLASASVLGGELVLTIPCDMPFLPADLPDRLEQALPGKQAALAASGGHVHPVCALWRREALAQLDHYAGSGRRSLIGFAETVGYAAVEWPGDPFRNLNTPGELAAAEALLG